MRSYRFPQYKKKIKRYSVLLKGKNISCGDSVDFYFILDKNGNIKDISWNGEGCALSQASAELLSEHFLGKEIASVFKFSSKQYLANFEISQLSALRLKCALLPLEVLKTYKK